MTTERINLGGQTSLPELACLYKKAKMVISTDSGPMHLAAAMGTRSLLFLDRPIRQEPGLTVPVMR